MIRNLYRCLVWLHPPSFRMQFEDEMLWIFDQAAGSWSATALLADAGLSLARQWLKGSVLWKGVGAIIGGIVPLVIGYGSFIPWERVWHALRSAF
jgi:hypothetical protein